jgi:hypothetical protein
MRMLLTMLVLNAIVFAANANSQDYFDGVSPEAPLPPSRAGVQPISESSASLEHDLESFDASMTEMGGESAGECECCDCGCFGHPFAECIWTRDRMLGNLFGAESRLAQHGIIADIEVTQFYQSVASGGVEQTDAYGGKADYMLTFLGEQMGLWKGFTTILHAETRFGEAVQWRRWSFRFSECQHALSAAGTE